MYLLQNAVSMGTTWSKHQRDLWAMPFCLTRHTRHKRWLSGTSNGNGSHMGSLWNSLMHQWAVNYMTLSIHAAPFISGLLSPRWKLYRRRQKCGTSGAGHIYVPVNSSLDSLIYSMLYGHLPWYSLGRLGIPALHRVCWPYLECNKLCLCLFWREVSQSGSQAIDAHL